MGEARHTGISRLVQFRGTHTKRASRELFPSPFFPHASDAALCFLIRRWATTATLSRTANVAIPANAIWPSKPTRTERVHSVETQLNKVFLMTVTLKQTVVVSTWRGLADTFRSGGRIRVWLVVSSMLMFRRLLTHTSGMSLRSRGRPRVIF